MYYYIKKSLYIIIYKLFLLQLLTVTITDCN